MMRLDLEGDENPALPILKSEAWGAVVLANQNSLRQHLLNPPQCLPRPLLVLDERKPHMPIAVVAEANPGRHRGLCLREQYLRKLERAELAVLLRNLCPHK